MKKIIDDKKIRIFGYGSLLSEESLQETAPNSKIISNGFISNYMRIFNKPAKNEYVAALNVVKSSGDFVNGVVIELHKKDFFTMIQREFRYDMVLVQVQTSIGYIEAYTFSYRQEDEREFISTSKDQIEYVELCIEGAIQRGEEFYEKFMNSTFIKQGITLKDYYDKTKKIN